MTDWKDLLAFNRRERNGILLLTGCMIAFSLIRFIITSNRNEENFITRLESMDFSARVSEFKKSKEKLERNASIENEEGDEFVETNRTILEYPEKDHPAYVRKAFQPLELNTADSAMLERLPMIGAKMASRIIKFRNSLGGFSDITQVREVYGVNNEAISVLDSLCIVDASKMIPIRINDAVSNYSFHPYLSMKQWKTMRAYIEKHGPLSRCEDLKSTLVMSDEEISRLCPYLQFN